MLARLAALALVIAASLALALPAPAPLPSYVVVTPAPAPWLERPLPAGVPAWRDDIDDPARDAAYAWGDAGLPVPLYAVQRLGNQNRELQLIYAAGGYDLPGELLRADGLWFTQTERGRWRRPLYLGLQQRFPYMIAAASALPMLDGDTLRLEVRVREIDPDSITFPPVGARIKRSRDGLTIELSLSALAADSDGDGLTDVEEQRVGLDPARADTDGDGADDGADPLPLTPYRRDADARMAMAVLSQLLAGRADAIPFEPGAALVPLEGPPAPADAPARERTRPGAYFVVADPRLFAGLNPPFRLIVYTPADLAALGSRPAFYPAEILSLRHGAGARERRVRWSARWVGGEFVVRCPARGPCRGEHLSQWIT